MPQTGHTQSVTPQPKQHKYQQQQKHYDPKNSNALLPFHPPHSVHNNVQPSFHKNNHLPMIHSQANLSLPHQPPVYLSSSTVLPHTIIDDDQTNQNRQLLALLDSEPSQSNQTPKPLHTGSMKYRLGLILDDLCCRFIANCPSEEHTSFERLFFQIEYAHWYYEDFFREDEKLPSFHLKEFARIMFNHCSLLSPYANSLNELWDNFKNYKFQVPAYGAILLNPTQDKCLLVKGWRPRSSWGFPKGKINKNEPESDCAIREVIEETGFDISNRLVETDYIEGVVNEQKIKLYVILNIDESTPFAPRTRKEISKIEWHVINDLPVNNQHSKEMLSVSSTANYYMVYPFVGKLKSWIKKRQFSEANKNPKQIKGRRSGTQTDIRPNNAIQQSASSSSTSSSSLILPTPSNSTAPSSTSTLSLPSPPVISPQPSSGETSPELSSQSNRSFESISKLETVKDEIDTGKQIFKNLLEINGIHVNYGQPASNKGIHVMKVSDSKTANHNNAIRAESLEQQRGQHEERSFFSNNWTPSSLNGFQLIAPSYSSSSLSSSSLSSPSLSSPSFSSSSFSSLSAPSSSLAPPSLSSSSSPSVLNQLKDVLDVNRSQQRAIPSSAYNQPSLSFSFKPSASSTSTTTENPFLQFHFDVSDIMTAWSSTSTAPNTINH